MHKYEDILIDAFQDELQKIALDIKTVKKVAPLAAGAVAWEGVRRANEDRKLGKQLRLQQG